MKLSATLLRLPKWHGPSLRAFNHTETRKAILKYESDPLEYHILPVFAIGICARFPSARDCEYDAQDLSRGAFPYETQRKRVHQPSERKRARRPESHFDQRGGGGEVPAHPQAGEKEDGRPDLRAPRGHHRHGRMGRSGPLNLAKDPGTASPLRSHHGSHLRFARQGRDRELYPCRRLCYLDGSLSRGGSLPL